MIGRKRRLPPINALLTFDAVVRHGSFTSAAEDLCITQSAVSQRVRQLEDFLNVRLFDRLIRKVQLTKEGERLAPRLEELLSQLEALCTTSGTSGMTAPLSITVVASFARRWLLPRLSHFQQTTGYFPMRLTTTASSDLNWQESSDAAILWGRREDWPGMSVLKFLDCEMFPVCHPSLCQGARPLRHPADLQRHILLRHSRIDYWKEWLALVDIVPSSLNYVTEYDDASMALEAAAQGQGVCMTTLALASDDLSRGNLVRPFEATLKSDYSYCLVHRKAKTRDPRSPASNLMGQP